MKTKLAVIAGMVALVGQITQAQQRGYDAAIDAKMSAAFDEWCLKQGNKHVQIQFFWTDKYGVVHSEVWQNYNRERITVPAATPTPTPTSTSVASLKIKIPFNATGNFRFLACQDSDNLASGLCAVVFSATGHRITFRLGPRARVRNANGRPRRSVNAAAVVSSKTLSLPQP